MHQPDEHCSGKGAAYAAQPAGDDHHKGLHDHGHVHLQVGRLAGQLQCAAEAGQGATQHHRAQHQRPGIDAQRTQDFAVLCGRAQALAKERASEKQVQAQPDQRPQQQ